jgi:cytochrome c
MDFEMAADGTMWLLEYGTEWWFNTNGRIRRLLPSDGNKPPAVAAARDGAGFTATASDPEGEAVTIEWWPTEGAHETKLGTGPALTVATTGGSELRAVAKDAKGAIAVARIALVEEKTGPALELELADKTGKPGFGDEIAFSVKGQADPAKTVVRARYIPPTGHDAGGPQFTADIEKLVISKQCFACHQVEKASVGPAYLDVAMKYRTDAAALERLRAKLKTGGGGVWGEVPMPPQVAVNDAEGETIVKAILGLSSGMAETRGTATGMLKLSAQPEGAQAGGAWEIIAEAPGYRAARTRIPAK